MRSSAAKIKRMLPLMPNLADALSSDRFGTYLAWAGGAPDLAERLYTYNVRLSAALYGPLHMLEVTMRNRINVQLAQAFGPAWLNDPKVLATPYQASCVRQAEQTLRQGNKPVTASRIVAELNFGFWCPLFGRQSHHLWQVLRPIFLAKGIQRSPIAHELRETRVLRNRVAHYEPILGMALGQRYASITTLTGWLSPSAAAWIAGYSDWPRVYPGVPILIPDSTARTFQVAPAVISFLP